MKKEFFLVLPDIRSCHNVGAMFRTADAMGVTKLFLCGYTAVPPKPQIDKVSLGAETWMPFEQYDSVFDCLKKLKDDHVHIIALEQTVQSVNIDTCTFEAPVALILGNEVDGVSQEVLALCDTIVHIPMHGRKESLNVSVAAGIAMHSIKRAIGE